MEKTLADAYASVAQFTERYRASGLGGERDPLGAVSGRLLRTLSYLPVIQERVEVGWATARELMDRVHREVASGPMDDAARALYEQQNAAVLRVELDLESFAIFAKLALDAVPPLVGVVVGHTRGVKTSSFNDLLKTISKLDGQVAHPPSQALIDDLQIAFDEVIHFRDKAVVHRRKLNQVQGVGWSTDQKPYLTFITVYPRSESDSGHQGATPSEAVRPIATAVCAVVGYLETLIEA